VGSPYGALLGGLALGIVQEVSTWSGFHGGVNPIWKPVIAFVVLIVALLFRPQGLLGRARSL
jgi:branched-subunit amino acid ABC-type transport system permease component